MIRAKGAQGKENNIMSTNYDERDVTFEIIEEIGVISTAETGWSKEVNLVSWNGGVVKYDIREWDPYHERMSRGITLKEEEMRRILELMKKRRNKSRTRGKEAVAEETHENAYNANAAGDKDMDDADAQPADAVDTQ